MSQDKAQNGAGALEPENRSEQTMHKSFYPIAVTTLGLLLGGCGGPSDFTPTEGMSAVDIYAQACAICDGENGAGKFGFLFKLAGSESSVEAMARALEEGGTIMPSFPNLSHQQRLMMAGYIMTL
jgi:mono/diheme cytochrome c family protein